MNRYDCIVLGTGGVGSAALYHLARRGLRVLGVDRFPPAHDRGSSHGETRVIRLAYFEHPDYVPLLRRSYDLWAELQEQHGAQLYHEVGLLEVGPEDGVVVPGVLQSAREHGLEVERLDAESLADDLPGFRVPEGYGAVYERRAGYLLVEDCVRAHLDLAVRMGAELRTEAVVGWRPSGEGVIVQTTRSSYAAARLVVTAGAWAGRLLRGLGPWLRVRRKSLFWFATGDVRYREERSPCFFYELPGGQFYGFPVRGGEGLKVAEHTGGRPLGDPLEVDRTVDPEEELRLQRFLTDHLPGVSTRRTRHATCLYTVSEDEDFIVDRHPEHPQVVFAAGLSGHGFKMSSGLGEVLADLAERGRAELPIEFLGLDRLSRWR